MISDFDGAASFVAREVFPPTDEHVALLRFLVCVRQLGALRGSVARLAGAADEGDRESFHLHVLLMVGAAKEAADAFRDCDGRGYFLWLDQPDAGLDDIREDLATARRHTDKSSDRSTYSRILKPFRDRAAFHISRDAIAAALEELTTERLPAAILGPNTEVKAIPIVSLLLAHLTWAASSAAGETHRIDDLYDLATALRNVAHDFYFGLVRVRRDPCAAPNER